MIYRMISGKQIVSKVFADLNIKEGSNRIADMIEWISEAVEKIGSVKQLKRVVSGSDDAPYLKINNHQASLPSDLFRLNQVAFSSSANGNWVPMKISTSSFNSWGSIRPEEDLTDLDSKMRPIDTTTESGLTYSIKPGYINTSVKDGYIKLSYDAIPVDEDGYPLVPDNISYAEAVYWYVVMKLKYPEYLSGKMDQGRYHDIRRSWNFYCKQAYGDSMMPTLDEMDSIKNSWLRLMPEINEHDSFYKDVSTEQKIYNKTR